MQHKISKSDKQLIQEKMHKMGDKHRDPKLTSSHSLEKAERDGARVPARKFHKLRKALGAKDE